MTSKHRPLPVWMRVNAWREILARVFEGVEMEPNISPAWLVNPATNRRLKLDLLYPELSLAVRFEGLQGKQRRQRPSLEEEMQQRARDKARVELCRANGIELIVINVWDDDPKPVFQAIDLSLSRAGQQTQALQQRNQIRQARATASAISRRVNNGAKLKLYANLWEDRQYQIAEPQSAPTPPAQNVAFSEGMEVEHTKFGPGVILAVSPGDHDTLVTVDFITAGQKILAASLVAGKLLPR